MSSKTKGWRLEIKLLRRGRGEEKKVGAYEQVVEAGF